MLPTKNELLNLKRCQTQVSPLPTGDQRNTRNLPSVTTGMFCLPFSHPPSKWSLGWTSHLLVCLWSASLDTWKANLPASFPHELATRACLQCTFLLVNLKGEKTQHSQWFCENGISHPLYAVAYIQGLIKEA